ncbi:unnamed protein product [Prunus armeniaca]
MFFACSELFLENDGIVLEFSEGSRSDAALSLVWMGSVEEHHRGDFNEVESGEHSFPPEASDICDFFGVLWYFLELEMSTRLKFLH